MSWAHPAPWGNLDSGDLDRDRDFISSFQIKPISIYDPHFHSFMTLVAVAVAQHRINTQPVCISWAIHLRSSRSQEHFTGKHNISCTVTHGQGRCSKEVAVKRCTWSKRGNFPTLKWNIFSRGLHPPVTKQRGSSLPIPMQMEEICRMLLGFPKKWPFLTWETLSQGWEVFLLYPMALILLVQQRSSRTKSHNNPHSEIEA